jgi:hypothetical protein
MEGIMIKAIFASIVLGGATGLAWAYHETLGFEEAWPLVLGLALGALAARRAASTAISVAGGIVAAWAVFIVVTLMLPFIPLSFGLATGVAIAMIGIAAAAVRGASLAGMLVGFAAFFAVYERTWLDDRPGFLGDSVSAAATLALALFGGMLAYGILEGAVGFARERRAEVTEAAPAEIDLRERVIDVTEPTPTEEADKQSPQQMGGFRAREAQ